MTVEPATPASAAAIAADTPCLRCGYNLRGLAPEGRCPECALDIARSLKGNRLATADPRWVRRLFWGTVLLVGYHGIFMAAMLSMMIASGRVWNLQLGLLFILLGMDHLLAIWLLSSVEPQLPEGCDPCRTPWAMRVCGVLASGSFVLAATAVMMFASGSFAINSIGSRLFNLASLLLLAEAPALFLVYRRLANLLRRIPSTWLPRMATFLAWFLGSVLLFSTAVSTMSNYGLGGIAPILGSISQVTALGFLFLPPIPLILFARAFRRAAKAASQAA